jgi:DNA-binding PadR family transcriptional regulator
VARDPRDLLPLSPLVLEILLALGEGERHGWSLVRDLQEASGVRIMPANFYRTLRGMLADGLIEETPPPAGDRRSTSKDALERRRYFALTSLGRTVARLEAHRLQAVVDDTRLRRLLKPTPRKP